MKDTPTDLAKSGKYTWYVVLLLTVVNVFSYMDRMALAMLAPFIKADLSLSDSQLGLLTGLAFSLFYAMCGIPIARWADRGTRRNIIALALTVWSAMTALSGGAQNFWHLFSARVGVGAGEAGCLPPAQSIICDYVPFQRRPGVFAIHNFGNYAGLMVGLVLAGWLGESIGWRSTFLALGAPGLVLALIVRFTLREPVRGVLDMRNPNQATLSLGATLVVLWRCKTYRLLTLFYVLNGFVQYGLNQWWPSFYVRIFGLSLSSIGISLGLAIGVGSGLGLLAGGLLANRVVARDIRAPLRIGAGATVLALPAALVSLFTSSPVISILMVSLTAFFWSASNGPIVATATGVVNSSMRATAAAINILFASVLGFGLGPFCVGLLSDLLAPSVGTLSLRYALLAPISFLPAMALVAYAAARSFPADLETVGAKT